MVDGGVPGMVPELSLGEYVEPVEQKEMLKALFEDPQIPRWPRHLASHHGEIEGGEVLDNDPSPPVNLSPLVGSILESVWIDVVPSGAIEIRHQVVSQDNEPEMETLASEGRLNDEIISDEEIAVSLEKDSEEEEGERVKETSGEGETPQVKDAYVSLRKLKIRRWKTRDKIFKKKKRQRWMFEKDRDWKPPRRKKVKITPKIKLIRTRPISEDDEPTEPEKPSIKTQTNLEGDKFQASGRDYHLLPNRAKEDEERKTKKSRRARSLRRFRDDHFARSSGPVIKVRPKISASEFGQWSLGSRAGR